MLSKVTNDGNDVEHKGERDKRHAEKDANAQTPDGKSTPEKQQDTQKADDGTSCREPEECVLNERLRIIIHQSCS